MGKVKCEELDVAKSQMQEWEDGKIIGQELDVSKNHLQEWEDDTR